MWVRSLDQEDPLEKEMATLSSILAWRIREGNSAPLQYSCLENPMDRGAWKAVVHGVAEGRTRLSDFTFTFHFYALEKEMATHSNVLAWRIPGKGKPGGLPSLGSQSWTRLKWLSSSSKVCFMVQNVASELEKHIHIFYTIILYILLCCWIK